MGGGGLALHISVAITHSILEKAMYKTDASSMFMCCLGTFIMYK